MCCNCLLGGRRVPTSCRLSAAATERAFPLFCTGVAADNPLLSEAAWREANGGHVFRVYRTVHHDSSAGVRRQRGPANYFRSQGKSVAHLIFCALRGAGISCVTSDDATLGTPQDRKTTSSLKIVKSTKTYIVGKSKRQTRSVLCVTVCRTLDAGEALFKMTFPVFFLSTLEERIPIKPPSCP